MFHEGEKHLYEFTNLHTNSHIIHTHPSWSIAITLKCFARASKFRKKKPWEAPYPWTITRVGEPSLLSKVTVLINLGSLLNDRNHLTFVPGGPDPMLTCSWVKRVLILDKRHKIKVSLFPTITIKFHSLFTEAGIQQDTKPRKVQAFMTDESIFTLRSLHVARQKYNEKLVHYWF